MRKIYISILLLFIGITTIYASGGRLNSSGCHNSSTEGYHCHNNSYTEYDSFTEEFETRELTVQEIIDLIREGKECSRIDNSKDKIACYSIKKEGDIYSNDEIKIELKKNLNCYKFSKYKSNNNQCLSLKNSGVLSISEIKEMTGNFGNCTKIKKLKGDYLVCIESKNNIKNNKVDSNKTQKKIENINNKITVIYNEKPALVKKLHIKIKATIPKLKKGTDRYILIIAIDKKIQELLNNTPTKLDSYKSESNNFNDSFSKAKKYLENSVYNSFGNLEKNSFYCSCDYNDNKEVDNSSCGFENNRKYITRSKKIEWEHIVPAQAFGQSFKEWRDGHQSCVDSKGKAFTGRNCASKVNLDYRYMQADMYNLVPAIGSINALRSNYSFAEIEGEKREFGTCNFEISNRKAEPKEVIKGDIARIYMYMESAYPGHGVISNKNEKLFKIWDKQDPVSVEECKRYQLIKSIQGNENGILKERCKN